MEVSNKNNNNNNKNGNEGKSGSVMGVESGGISAATAAAAAAPAWHLVLVAAIACGIQFGWALQLSLLTPYVQLLGIPHDTAPIIWLCGPVSGMIVQPFVGFYSDKCNSRFGRRRPFIAAGAALVVVAVFLIGFAADIGHGSGDPLGKEKKPRAIGVFIVGFAILDVANNMLQGPCRALLSDLGGGDARKTRISYAGFSFFMAVGNVIGYAAGSYSKMYRIFPFTKTDACDVYCANLKSCFLISVALLLSVTILALSVVREIPLYELDLIENKNSDAAGDVGDEKNVQKTKTPFLGEIITALREMSRPMKMLLLVTFCNWLGWFPFVLFDTDWTGREIYGSTSGNERYDTGVRMGSMGLLLNSVVLAVTSISTEQLSRLFGGAKRLWGAVNFLLAICLGLTVLISKLADSTRRADGRPASGIKAATLGLFSVMGIPLSITYSVPFALASIYSTNSGSGQGLSLGVLNLSIVVPQMIVSLVAGHFDALFGGGNLPAFVAGGVAALVSAVLAIFVLPSPPQDVAFRSKGMEGGFH